MDCKHCGLRIERVPENCSEIQYVHSEKINGAKVVCCAYANPLSHGDFYDEKVGYLVAEPVTEHEAA